MLQAYIYAEYLLEDAKQYLLTPKRGQGLVEYALILVFIVIGVIAVLTLLGPKITQIFDKTNKAITVPQ